MVRAPDDTGWAKPPAASSKTLLAKALLGDCSRDSRGLGQGKAGTSAAMF
jgi:hypothetical protein